MQNRKLRRESTRIYSKKEKDMEANASTNAEFVLATLGNDAGMYVANGDGENGIFPVPADSFLYRHAFVRCCQ